ncbi:NACHT and WD repeat domain-containing protein [Phytohabitans suffuscus]
MESAPYVGLAAFRTADAGKFFGRDRLVAQLCARVAERRFVIVVGASGSGKSSLLQAGLLHHAQTHGLRGTADGPRLVMAPGPRPLEECAARLAALAGTAASPLHAALRDDPRSLHLTALQALVDKPSGAELLVVVDQFEEVFTLCADPDERAQLVAVLAEAAHASNSRTRVVLGVRADFYAHCAEYPVLVDALRDAQVLVGPMTTAELRSAITQPALDVGCRVETALVSELIADATGQPGVLPLVSHALLETWRRRRGTTLTLAGYRTAGGLDQSVAHTAETVYTSLSDTQQRWVRQLFVRLVALGEGTQDTRRRVDRAELDPDNPETTTALERLAHARLVILDRDSVEITHEALVRCWPRLHSWLTEDREGLRIHRQITDAVNAWERLDRDPGALYRGSRLSQASQWVSAGGDSALSTREQDFLRASLAEQARDQLVAHRRATRLRQLLAVLTVLLVLTTAATAYALRARHVSVGQRNLAITQKVLSQAAALRATNPALAMQLGLAAYRIAPVAEARTSLLNMFTTPYAARLTGHSGAVNTVAFSPDGHTLATGDEQAVRLWDSTDPTRASALATLTGLTGPVSSVAFSPDGHTVAALGRDDAARATIRLWDVTDAARPHRLASMAPASGLLAGSSLSFSPDGRVLASGGTDEAGHGTIRLWDVVDPGRPHELTTPTTPAGPIYRVAFGPTGRILATAAAATADLRRAHEVRLWDLTDPARPREVGALTGQRGFVQVLAFSPDGNSLVTGLDDAVTLWDVRDPRQPAASGRPIVVPAAVSAAAFSPDRHTLATATADRGVHLWDVTDVRRPRALATLPGAAGTVSTVAYRPDGRTLAVGGLDPVVRLEDVAEYAFPSRAEGRVVAADFSPDGRVLATAHVDGTVGLSDATDPFRLPEPARFTVDPNGLPVIAVAFGADGHLLATTDGSGRVTLWQVGDTPGSGLLTAVLVDSSSPSAPLTPALAFGPDRRTLAASGEDNSVRLWDIGDPHRPRPLATLTGFAGAVNSVAFSPDGHLLATASTGASSRLWDVSDPLHPRSLGTLAAPAAGQVLSVAFDPRGRTLAVANVDRTVGLWDLTDASHPQVRQTLPFSGMVHSMAFSPDGRRLAAGAADGTTSVWDVTDPERPQPSDTLVSSTSVYSVSFSPNNHVLATAGVDWSGQNETTPERSIRLWEMDAERVATRVCGLARPAITPAEWERYFPGLAYQPPCQ